MSNQVIYDRIWESRKLARCSLKAALAYPWIYLVADDWGRFEYLPRVIWGKVFGAREDVKATDVTAWMAEYEDVGLLVTYEVEGRRIGRWHRFVGPPPSKRKPSILPDESGNVDTEGLKAASRFHSGSGSLPIGSLQAEAQARSGSTSRKLEAEAQAASGKEPPPPPAPAGIDHDPADPLQVELVRRCQELAGKAGEDDTPLEILRAVSATPKGKTLESLRRAPKAWVEQTLRACDAFEADLEGDVPDLQRTGDQQGDFELPEGLDSTPERPPPREPT